MKHLVFAIFFYAVSSPQLKQGAFTALFGKADTKSDRGKKFIFKIIGRKIRRRHLDNLWLKKILQRLHTIFYFVLKTKAIYFELKKTFLQIFYLLGVLK